LLKLEARCPGSICQGRHAAVIPETPPVEADFVHAGREGPLGHRLADRLGSLLVAAEADGRANLPIDRTG